MSSTKLNVAVRVRFKQKTRHLTNSCVMSPCPGPSPWHVTPQALSTQQQFASLQSSDCRGLQCRRGKGDGRKGCTRLSFSSHLDLHPSLPGGLVLSNQRLIYDNIWCLAAAGHISMQMSLQGLMQCDPTSPQI